MYQNIFIDKKRKDGTKIVHLWDDEKGYVQFEFPVYAYRRSQTGTYKSLYGDTLEKIQNFDFNEPDLFESDLQPELRVLLDAYEDSDEPSQGHRTIVFDIEVDITGGFPIIELGDKAITAIALHDSLTNQYFAYILDPEKKIADGTHEDTTIISFREEASLLTSFLNKWQEIGPTVVTGWNSNYFDVPYLYNRIKVVLGKDAAYSLSPIGVAYQNKYTKRMVIAGVSCLDYLELYKKFLGIMRPQYSLGAVAKIEGLKNQKLTYKGSLTDLYRDDLARYVEYNLVDVKIVVELDEKYDFNYLARSVCHKGHIPYEWFQMSSRFIDGAILMYLHRHNMIAPNKPVGGREEYAEMEKEGEDGFIGAYVKEPVPGVYDWICSADITSLYPSVIMTLNVSPETKIGKIRDWDYTRYHKGEIPVVNVGAAVYTKDEFDEILADQKIAISSNGIMYRQDMQGVVPTILDLWFNERIEYRDLAKQYKKDGDVVKAAFYNRRQLRQKIFLNSVYGTLGLPIFRFYDKDNAEATTVSGQTIIRSAEKLVNMIYHQKFEAAGIEPPEQDFVKYIDTDSVYISAVPLAMCEETYPTDMKQFTIGAITEVAGKINDFYKVMVPKVFNVSKDKNRINIIGDVVAKKAMWMAKKRYAMLKVFDMENMMDVTDKDGNEGKIEVKGIDTVRSSFPAAFRVVASKVLDMLLRGSEKVDIDELILVFEDNIENVPILDLGKGTSVKFISQKGDNNYNPSGRKVFQFEKKTPIGVKSALAYNDLLTIWGLDVQYEKVLHGQKIKWVYLIPNEYGINSLAVKGDETDPDVILDMMEKYIDRGAMYNAELKSKVSEFYKVKKWDYPSRGTQMAVDFFGGDDGGESW
jgi:DNA polymerase elongation subunit (family B)